MKPRAVVLSDALPARDAMRCVIDVRFAEACELSAALENAESKALHQFRIACKRLRYALERCDAVAPALAASAPQLALLADALGTVHDCDVLAAEIPDDMPRTRARVAEQRTGEARRAVGLWNDACIVVRESLRYYEVVA